MGKGCQLKSCGDLRGFRRNIPRKLRGKCGIPSESSGIFAGSFGIFVGSSGVFAGFFRGFVKVSGWLREFFWKYYGVFLQIKIRKFLGYLHENCRNSVGTMRGFLKIPANSKPLFRVERHKYCKSEKNQLYSLSILPPPPPLIGLNKQNLAKSSSIIVLYCYILILFLYHNFTYDITTTG